MDRKDRKTHHKDEGNRDGKENMRSVAKFIHMRGVLLSEDSGNYSLNTSTTDSSCDNLSRGGEVDLRVEHACTRGRYS